jgi:hypothetical protein
MEEEKKIKILKSILGNFYCVNDELLFYCPYCKHQKRKMSVNIRKNAYKCWVCDTNGRDIRRVVRRFGSYNQKKKWDELTNRVDLNKFPSLFESLASEESSEEQRTPLPKEFHSLANKAVPISALPAIKYLKSRGITKEDILYWKIGYCDSGEYQKRVIVPSFDTAGYVNYFVARSYIEQYKRYKNPQASRNIIFNELYLDWDQDLVIVEGAFDAIVAGNSVPLLGSTLREGSKLFQEIVSHDTPIFLALDQDASYKEEKIIRLLLKYDIELYKIDTSNFQDVGEMTKKQFKEQKENATFITHGDYLLRKALNNV